MAKITAKITEDDALDFLIRHYDETKKKKNNSRFLLSLFFIIFAFYFLITGHTVKAVIFFALSVGWYFILPFYLRSAVTNTYRAHVKNNMGMIINKPITYELKEKGLYAKYELEEATYQYKFINGISREGRNIYVHHNGKVPLIIPYSGDTAKIDNFISSLEKRLEENDKDEEVRQRDDQQHAGDKR